MKPRRGFTILELAVVMSVIAILLGIVTTAASGAIRQGRVRKAESLCTVVQAGLATYYAQKDRWPGSVGDKIASDSLGTRSNEEGTGGQTDVNQYILTASEVREMVKALVDEAKRGNPLMDISGLFVSRDAGEKGGHGLGLDFMDAIHGTRKSSKKMSTSEMNYGYPEAEHGYFRRFKIVYSIPTDEMKVSQQ